MQVPSAGWLYVTALVTPLWVWGLVFFVRTFPRKTTGPAGQRRAGDDRITRGYILRWRLRNLWHKQRLERELLQISRPKTNTNHPA